MAEPQNKKGAFGNLSEAKLNELRQMILGLDTEDLQRLSRLVNDPDEFSNEISELLPYSIKLMLDRDNVSYTALMPVVEAALRDSVKKNPKVLADVLFPIMMPAIRKAVNEDISRMIESLNSTLENGFSPKRIGWRLRSLFSSTSYAEIVLSNAYVYRVKQVFLIHKKTGLLISEVSGNDSNVAKDSDMVSSMLSAIKDFVQDSFDIEQDNELNTIKIGHFNIWIEQGPEAIIAAIVEGNAPSTFSVVLKEAIENIHLKQSYQLQHFEGDTSVFSKSDPYLNSCVLSEEKVKKKKKPVILIILVLLLLGWLSYYSYTVIEKNIRIGNLLEVLDNEDGIVVISRDDDGGKAIIRGLKDPYANNPYRIAEKNNVDSSEVIYQLKSYISLDDNMVLKRAYAILLPPNTVKFSYDAGTLFASGDSYKSWVDSALNNYHSVSGVINFDIANISIIDEVEAVSIKSHVDSLRPSIEKFYFYFKYNKVELDDEQKVKFDEFIGNVDAVYNFDFSQDSVPVIVVVAHTSYEGNAVANKKIAFTRATEFINLMIAAGIPMEVLVPKTDYVEDIEDAYPVRSISFRVVYSKQEEL